MFTDTHAYQLEGFRTVRLNADLFPVGDFETKLFRKYGLKVTESLGYTPEEILSDVADCDALFAVSVSLPEEVIENLATCQVISRIGTGTDKIDVATATRKGIPVTNVPRFCVQEQADHTMALLLALCRKLPQMSQVMTEGAWREGRRLAIANRRLVGRVVGLIGFGNSAQAVATRALAFGMRVIATRRNLHAVYHETEDLAVPMVPLDTLLAESDYVSLHVPLTDETHHLLDASKLAMMKPEAYLINTSRGAIVDEAALVDFLRQGRIAGAGLDTFEHIDPFVRIDEPPVHPILSLDNVILTPHVASFSVEARQDVNRRGIENVVSILSGHWPHPESLVNRGVVPRLPLKDYDGSLFAE